MHHLNDELASKGSVVLGYERKTAYMVFVVIPEDLCVASIDTLDLKCPARMIPLA